MKNLFEIACGTTAGKDHRYAGKNSHDAVYFKATEDFFIGVVCDGCGSSKHSEVGAKIGARLLVQSITEQMHVFLSSRHYPINYISSMLIWENVRQNVLTELHILAKKMGSLSEIVTDYFLFTTVGVLITSVGAYFFSLGDGLIVINDEIIQIGPFPDNEPPYLSYGMYGMVRSSLQDKSPELLRFCVQRVIRTDELNSFLIGSDGAVDIDKVADWNLPGKRELVGPISQFWENDRFFNNPDNINRRLRLINEDYIRPDWEKHLVFKEGGLLSDDTTILVGRKRKHRKEGEI